MSTPGRIAQPYQHRKPARWRRATKRQVEAWMGACELPSEHTGTVASRARSESFAELRRHRKGSAVLPCHADVGRYRLMNFVRSQRQKLASAPPVISVSFEEVKAMLETPLRCFPRHNSAPSSADQTEKV